MSGPQPDAELKGHCATVHDDTLYVLSSDAFQSLPLKQNATWQQESLGHGVEGPACVSSGDALYVIGGTSDDSDYGGLQRFLFDSRKWESLSTLVPVMQNRANHSVAFLKDSSSILVYAGSQPDAPSLLSSQTFLIHTESPYNIEAFTSKAPASNQPILESWNGSHAVMAGGVEWNTAVYTFDPFSGWQQYPTSLTNPIDPASRGSIVDGSDGSKVLQLYDFSVSPNKVTGIVLQDANGQPAQTGNTVGQASTSTRKRKRDLTLDKWPSYNSTNAPSSQRTDCAISTGRDGLAVISGGSSEEPVALFDQSDNSWVDVSQFFGEKQEQQPLQPSSTQPSLVGPSTASATPSSSSSPGSGGGDTPHNRMLRTLGITLGVICGIAAVFVLILLLMRWQRIKKRKREGYLNEKDGENGKDRMSFQDRGTSFTKEADASVIELVPPNPNAFEQSANGPHSSLAIIAGKFSNGSKHNSTNHKPKSSYESTAPIVKNKDGDVLELQSMTDKSRKSSLSMKSGVQTHLALPAGNAFAESHTTAGAARPNRSSGWSRYFETTQPNHLSHIPLAYTNPDQDGEQQRNKLSRIPSSTMKITPLDIDFTRSVDGQRMSHVVTGSPSFNDSREDLGRAGAAGQKGVIESGSRPQSDQTVSSSAYDRSTISSTLTTDFFNSQIGGGHTPWTPMSPTFKENLNHSHSISSRPSTSSIYTSSIAEQRIPSRGKNAGFFPGAGTAYRPSPGKTAKYAGGITNGGVGAGANPEFSSPKQDLIPPAVAGAGDDNRDSTITVFPRGVTSGYYANREKGKSPRISVGGERKKAVTEDMSWLNINQQ
ncbi:hypothetical protein K431DRAFT_221333 [Polychaeton citri CBS 116435]|uniref:Galactose oxidase n=1 Tax=Polychaeton citri CBS 116435 TaxID=1314669 RepID=A0A9P4URF4_9PEZI|nr:hypothetical protein K431DRAFT_221333 [Polychaeton citri CBS 116435]